MRATVGLLGKWRRHRALARLEASALSRTWGARFGTWSAWYLAIAHAALIVWVHATTAVADYSNLVSRTMWLLTSTATVIALAAATDVKWQERNRWAYELSRQRGFTERQLQVARASAAIAITTRPILLPGLAVAGLALLLSDTFAGAFASFLRLLAVGAYAVIAGAVLGVLARWASLLCPGRPKSFFAAIIVLPYLAALAFGHVPNVVTLVNAMLATIAHIGGGIG